ncbi:Hypothetical protein UVM_LOCUS228 [uncultured virus]|nr:Hypothetical protein UVM_LOCUS228 [uncultured virus]
MAEELRAATEECTAERAARRTAELQLASEQFLASLDQSGDLLRQRVAELQTELESERMLRGAIETNLQAATLRNLLLEQRRVPTNVAPTPTPKQQKQPSQAPPPSTAAPNPSS